MSATSLLDDSFLRQVANTAGRSNTTTVSKEEKVRVQAAISEIQAQLHGPHSDEVTNKLLELQNQLAVAIAPHKLLPSELIGRAFSELVEDYIDVVFWDFCELRLLREICSHWRQIALDEHSLWSRIRIVWPPVSLSHPRRVVPISWKTLTEKAAIILPQTGPVAMELMTEIDPEVIRRFNISKTDVVSMLILPYSQRLYDLKVRCGPAELRKLLDIPKTAFPLLKTLTLASQTVGDASFASNDSSADGLVSIIDHSPCLQDLAIAVTNFDWLPYSVACPKLTYLQIGQSIAPDTLLSALSRCENLQDLSATLSPTAPQVASPINLPYLKCMQLCVNNINETFIDRLCLPMLSSLTLHSRTSPPIHKILMLISRSHCSIETFTDKCYSTPDAPVSSEEYQHLLSSMPKLRELTTQISADEALVRQVGGGALSPYLEVFNCNSSMDTVTFMDVLEAGLKSRSSKAPPKTSLRYVRMLESPGIGCDHPTFLKRTRELQKQHGIKLMAFAPVNVSELNFETF